MKKEILAGSVAVVTGAGSGLGRALSVQLYTAGATLALCDLNHAGLEETLFLLGNDRARVSLHDVDVADPEQMRSFSNDVLSRYGKVDILINNAGVTLTPTEFELIQEKQFKRVIDVNMWGVYNGIQAFLPHLKHSENAHIINISSLAGLVGLYGYSPYAMSKFAVRGLSEALQMELVGTNIHVLVVHPGGIKTNIIKNALNLSENGKESAHNSFSRAAMLTPEKAAQEILEAMQKKRYRLILGPDAKLVNLIRTLFPQSFPKILSTIFKQSTFR